MVSYYSTLEFKGFPKAPERPLADHFGSFSSRKIQVVPNNLKGFSYIKEKAPWHEIALKVALFILEVILVIPAIVFAIQKHSYRKEADAFLNSDQWTKHNTLLNSLNLFLPKIINKPFDQWTEQNFIDFKNEMAKAPIQKNVFDEDRISDFLQKTASKEDFFSLKSGDHSWQVNSLTTCRHSEFFKAALNSGMKEFDEKSISIHKPDGTPYSKEAIDSIVSYLNTGSFKPAKREQIIEVYKFARLHLFSERALHSIRETLTHYPFQDNEDIFKVWCCAREYEDRISMLQCAIKYDLEFPYNPQTEEEVEEIKLLTELAAVLRELDATIYDNELKIKHSKTENIEALTPYLLDGGIEILNLPVNFELPKLLYDLKPILENPDLHITELKVGCFVTDNMDFYNNLFSLLPVDLNALLQMINVSQKIQVLNLAHTPLDHHAVEYLVAALQNNYSLRSLELTLILYSEEFFSLLLTQISEPNSRIEELKIRKHIHLPQNLWDQICKIIEKAESDKLITFNLGGSSTSNYVEITIPKKTAKQ